MFARGALAGRHVIHQTVHHAPASLAPPMRPQRHSSAARNVGAAAYTGSSPQQPRAATLDPAEAAKRSRELVALLQETASIIVSTGPKGFFRTLQGARALAELTQEYLQSGRMDPAPVLLRKVFEKLGATYIKLGQFIASSPSLFPDDYVLEFQKCLDRTDPVPWADVERVIRQDLGKPVAEVFSYIDPTPLASASVAQVHAARLAGSNKEVVIKVLKPGVEDVLTADLSFVYLASRFLEFVSPELGRLSIAGVLADMRSSMIDETDFTKEAANVEAFSAFLDARGYRGLATAPYVYTQFSSRRLLVMERLRGSPLTDLDAIRRVTSREPEAVLIAALNTWFASVLGCPTFHADVHAGNLLVLPDGRVGFIDFGIVGRISPTTWKGVEALVSSMVSSDYDTMARALATIGATDGDVDFRAFARDLESFFSELENVNANVVLTNDAGPSSRLSASLEVDQTQVNRLLLQLVRVGEEHGVRFPKEFGLFLKQLLYFDRYTRILAPQLQVFSDERVNFRGLSVQYGL